jgi:hypothetical protein
MRLIVADHLMALLWLLVQLAKLYIMDCGLMMDGKFLLRKYVSIELFLKYL